MRTGNISQALKLLLLAVTVFITCIVIIVFIRASEEAKALSNGAIDQMTELNNDIIKSGITMYDDAEVYGYDVINFIKKNLGDYDPSETAPVYVYVKTSATENIYTNNIYIPDLDDFHETSRYIKPAAVFTGDIIRNVNDVIIGVRFIQK